MTCWNGRLSVKIKPKRDSAEVRRERAMFRAYIKVIRTLEALESDDSRRRVLQAIMVIMDRS